MATESPRQTGRPKATFHDVLTGVTVVREMSEEEYAALIESGWTEEGETPE